jgi:hypothetical protein
MAETVLALTVLRKLCGASRLLKAPPLSSMLRMARVLRMTNKETSGLAGPRNPASLWEKTLRLALYKNIH